MFSHYIDLSWRSFKRTPLVSLLMVLAIAVGIGITMTSLSVYHMMSMDPIPTKSDKLFAVQLQSMDEGETWWSPDSLPYQLTYRDAENLLNGDFPFKRAALMKTGFSIHLNSDKVKPFLDQTRVTSRDAFAMFNLQFVHGGVWSKEQEENAAPVAVISQSMSKKLFGTENGVGETFYLDDLSVRVAGVIEDWQLHIKYYDLNNGSFNEAEQIFIPFSLIKAHEINTWGNTNGWKHEPVKVFNDKLQSEKFWLQFWVELNNETEKRAFEGYLANYIAEEKKTGRFTREQAEYKLRDVNEWISYWEVVNEDNKIMVALSFMFLAVCLANILGLLLAKFLRRAPEVGVRRALGASKRQVFFQHIVEVGMLGLFGGVIGIIVAQLGLFGIRQSLSYYDSLANMDISMLMTAPIIAILACIIAGLYPAWVVCNTTPATYLKTQ
ncbi:ABC transporter ATP-binding protein [Pseudoalteromonas phenolica]|uniref:ABC transporter ATP-binding protein n=1 Tax=Pseudoalteromonas phenolica TaxID=161398 RepID=A0A4Q7ISL0_9GAMM|nr:ABC transporter permease [Pseudoalteromonas phenolica]RZQ55060.1 ABC transporter ATP-binding protein [Pseudoalteromonas phenolica]